MGDIINIHLYSQDAHVVEKGFWRFQLHETINLIGREATISLIEFQTLNSIYNITDKNNEFSGNIMPVGFYTHTDIEKYLKEKLDSTTISCEFDKKTLKFKFTSLFAFVLTGTLLSFLNISGLPFLIGGKYILESYRCFDIHKRSHCIHIITPNLRTASNTQVENNSHHVGTRIGKINIKAEFGEYIIYSDSDQNKSVLYEDMISRIDVMLKNDMNENIFDQEDFSLTLKIEYSDLEDREKAYLDNLTDKTDVVRKEGNNFNYPIVNRVVSVLKSSRDVRIEKFYRKEYLKLQGLKDDEIDGIEMKLKELFKNIIKTD